MKSLQAVRQPIDDQGKKYKKNILKYDNYVNLTTTLISVSFQVLEEDSTHKNIETQTDQDIEDIISEIEALEKLEAVVSGTRHSYRKSTSPVNRKSDLERADELLQELDSAILRNACTQTNNLSNPKVFKKTIEFPMPRRNVQSKTDHTWPKGHKLNRKFRKKQGLQQNDS